MRRFEREQDGARRFWEVDVDGERVRFTTGLVGGPGRTRTSVHRDPEQAARELGVAIRQMVATGWVEVACTPDVEPVLPPVALDADDPAAFLVHGDRLQADGDPRGELIAVQVALATGAGDADALRALEAELLNRHGRALLGPLFRREEPWDVTWYCGYIRELHLVASGSGSDAAGIVRELADADALGVLAALRVDGGETYADPLAIELARRSWPALRSLEIRGQLSHPTASLIAGMPALERLAVQLTGPLPDLGRIQALELWADRPLDADAIASQPLEALRELTVRGEGALAAAPLRRLVDRALTRLTVDADVLETLLDALPRPVRWAELHVSSAPRPRRSAELLLAMAPRLAGVRVVVDGDLTDAEHAALSATLDLVAGVPDARAPRDTLQANPRQEVPRRFQRVQNNQTRFWEIVREGAVVVTRYGAAGSPGTTHRRAHPDPETAAGDYRKRIGKKRSEGWVEHVDP